MVGLYHPKKVVPNIKNLPDYTRELNQRWEIDRFEFFVDKRHLEEMKDLDIEVSEGKIKPRLISPSIDRQIDRYDLRDTLGTRFESKFQYRSETLDLADIVYHN